MTLESKPSLYSLPTELQENIISFIEFSDLFSAFNVCRLWRELLQKSSLQRTRYHVQQYEKLPAKDIASITEERIFGMYCVHKIFHGNYRFGCEIITDEFWSLTYRYHPKEDSIPVVNRVYHNISNSPMLDDPVIYPSGFIAEEEHKEMLSEYMDDLQISVGGLWRTPWKNLEAEGIKPLLRRNISVRDFIRWVVENMVEPECKAYVTRERLYWLLDSERPDEIAAKCFFGRLN